MAEGTSAAKAGPPKGAGRDLPADLPLKRDRTTDVLRGLTSIGMYVVNTRSAGGPGFLNHGGFHGPVTFADVKPTLLASRS